MPYIKSHSNYILKSMHQNVNDGTVFERDITTIGGVDSFSPGQTPIYKSNNFIITVRTDTNTSNQYNIEKWKENETSGDVWTLESIGETASAIDNDNDTKIVLKQDYYDFRDFAYYGSLTELFRTSVTDIIRRFPGELYVTDHLAYYTVDGESKLLGEDYGGLSEVSNPFGINLHDNVMPNNGEPLRYFANNGWKNYVIKSDNEDKLITDWKVTAYTGVYNSSINKTVKYETYYENGIITSAVTGDTVDGKFPCKGDKIFDIKLNGDDCTIYGYLGDDFNLVYLSNNNRVHIRPKQEFLNQFYNECDNFERLLINKDTGYKATFSVIRENDYGYYREFVPFTFPKSEGGYNIDATTYGFNAYTEQMVKIGEYYDENFTDNLWRSMTHEAIKNFDWTYSREYQEGDEEEYVFGGQRIQKALRIFAREFDEILSYINNIKSINRVTYDERNNLPDYFLTDAIENDGWNVKLIYPYNLKEVDSSGNTYIDYTNEGGENCDGQLDNVCNGVNIRREFSQNPMQTVKPYQNSNNDYGYFNMCPTDNSGSEGINDVLRYDANALDGRGVLKNVIRKYYNDNEWSYQKVNNEFLRRLKINSPYILRHKGTIEGIEMILGMFGLKSHRWSKNGDYDYKVTEYASFANRIEETWDAVHQDYRINWDNSIKTFIYNSESTDYQGIPVSYRDEYVSDRAYIGTGSTISSITPSDSAHCFTREDGTPVLRRYLYPNFNNSEELDGNPYFQMNGGWMSKIIDNKWNFQFDVDDNIVYSKYVYSGSVDASGETTDNIALYKETVRNIMRVDNISKLLSIPTNNLYNGITCYVTNIESDSVVIDGLVYPIRYEVNGAETLKYISFAKTNGYIKVGNNKFFDTTIIVYNEHGAETTYDVASKIDGWSVKAYFSNNTFICKEDSAGNYSINSYQVIEDNPYLSNYYVLDDINYADNLGNDRISGWKRLSYTSNEYLKINAIMNDDKGNNPHNGNMGYDNGHEYFTYFSRIFKHAIDTDSFDSRCYGDYFIFMDEVSGYGFKGLINDNESIKQYDDKLIEDTKVHYFGNYKVRDNEEEDFNKIIRVWIYGDDDEKLNSYREKYNKEDGVEKPLVRKYNLSKNQMIGGTPYPSGDTIDEVTNQIVNNKRLTIEFKLNSIWYSNEGQCEIKYIDDIIMNYLTQMIPSSTILQIKYMSKQTNG